MITVQVDNLGYWSCFFLDPPPHTNQSDYLIYSNDQLNALKCFPARFLAGDTYGPVLIKVLSAAIAVVGTLGVFTNVINILVLKRLSTKNTLQRLLIILASFDLLQCFCAILSVCLLKVIADNVNRSRSVLITYEVFFLLYSLGRTGAIFITILVTAERYFAVAYPIVCRVWFTSRRSVKVTAIFFVLIFFVNLPWWIDTTVVKNDTSKYSDPQMLEFPYIFTPTDFKRYVYVYSVRVLHNFVDFVLPLPVLLIINGLLYRKIYLWAKFRTTLTSNQVTEVNAAKMFSILVMMLLACRTVEVCEFFVVQLTNTVYRELVIGIMLAVTINATVNFLIYYVRGQEFKECFWSLVGMQKNKKGKEEGLRKRQSESTV